MPTLILPPLLLAIYCFSLYLASGDSNALKMIKINEVMKGPTQDKTPLPFPHSIVLNSHFLLRSVPPTAAVAAGFSCLLSTYYYLKICRESKGQTLHIHSFVLQLWHMKDINSTYRIGIETGINEMELEFASKRPFQILLNKKYIWSM